MHISVSIVLYHNNPVEVTAAIDSVLASPLVKQLFLVDNSTTDQLRHLRKDTRIHYIHNKKNIGFGAAHNVAIRQALNTSDYHLVLNPDIKFEPGVIEALHEYMEANEEVGLAMPKILYKNGEIQRLCKLLPSPFQLFGRRFLGNSAWAKRMTQRYELYHFDYNRVMDVPNLSGCFMFLRVSMLHQAGIFDERYFMYLEDIDLIRRIGQTGRTVFYPEVSVYHGYQKGSYNGGKLMYFHIASAIKYFNKWGWFIDSDRKRLNKAITELLKKH